MSNWTEIRDNIEKTINIDNVTEDMKKDVCDWISATALPMVKTAADKFISQIKQQAETETGWNKVRDLIVLPALINGIIWIVEKSLSKAPEQQ